MAGRVGRRVHPERQKRKDKIMTIDYDSATEAIASVKQLVRALRAATSIEQHNAACDEFYSDS